MSIEKIAAEYNVGIQPAIDAASDHNASIRQKLIDSAVSAEDVKKSYMELPKACPEKFSSRWCKRWLELFSWKRRPTNTTGSFLEWDDPRMIASRNQVKEHLASGCHPFLVLNFDQLWRQSLRPCSHVFMKAKTRCSAILINFVVTVHVL